MWAVELEKHGKDDDTDAAGWVGEDNDVHCEDHKVDEEADQFSICSKKVLAALATEDWGS